MSHQPVPSDREILIAIAEALRCSANGRQKRDGDMAYLIHTAATTMSEWYRRIDEVSARDTEIARLQNALETAANALEEVAEMTWDKRRPDECLSACENASLAAGGACEEARAILATNPSHTQSPE